MIKVTPEKQHTRALLQDIMGRQYLREWARVILATSDLASDSSACLCSLSKAFLGTVDAYAMPGFEALSSMDRGGDFRDAFSSPARVFKPPSQTP